MRARSTAACAQTLPVLVLVLVLLLLSAGSASARMGGGEGFSTGGGEPGGGGFGSSGGSGDGLALFLLVEMAFRHPVVGVPLLIVVALVMMRVGRSGYSRHMSRSIRTGYRIQDALDRQASDAGLQKLRERDPGFTPEAFTSRVTAPFPRLQEAWSAQDMRPLRPLLSDGVYERLQLQLEMMKARRLRNRVSEVQVLSTRIAGARSDAFFDTVHVEIAASARDEWIHTETGKPWKGGGGPVGSFTEVWSFLRRPGARTLARPGLLEGSCPNCGAPLELSDSVACPSCGSLVNSGEYDWVLAEITQASAWRDRPGTAVPGLGPLTERDPAFTPQHLEDRASVIFWRMRAAEFFASDSYLKKVALPEYLERSADLFQPRPDGRHRFHADAALGSVEIVEVRPAEAPDGRDTVRVKMAWSGHPETETVPGFLPPRFERSGPVVPEYLLVRKAGVLSSARNALASTHCPGCGAPQTRDDQGRCAYCGLPQNDGSSGWVLESARPYTGAAPSAGAAFASSVARELGIAALRPATALRRVRPEESEVLLACAVAVMKADGRVDEREVAQLKEMAARRRVDPDRLERIVRDTRPEENAPGPAGAGCGAPDPEFLRSMILMCLADGNLSQAERAVVQRLGARMGQSPADTDKLIRQERAALYRESRRVRKDAR